METTQVHKSEVKRSNWQPPTHSQTRQHTSQSSCTGCGACRKIARSTNTSASIMLKSLDPGKKVCATRFLQRTYGNRYVQRLIQTKTDSSCLERCGSRAIQMKASGCCGGCANHGKEEEESPVQTKLAIGMPGDRYEQEADRISEQVMRMPEPEVERQPEEEEEEEIQMQANMNLAQSIPPIEEGEEEQLQRKEVGGGTTQVSVNVQPQINSLRGGGQPLPESARNFFGPRFDYDFSGVRIHTDGRAQKIARSINARAFTVGKDVAFGVGEYSPETTEGKKLLAHELAHVVQQSPSRIQTKYSGLPGLPRGPVRIQATASDTATIQRWSVNGPANPALNTIVCDGSGGIAVQAGATGNAQQTACLRDCIVRHEESHRADALAENANICNGKRAGSQLLFGPGQQGPSEIRASNVEIGCLRAKLPRASDVCRPIINARITQMEAYRDSF